MPSKLSFKLDFYQWFINVNMLLKTKTLLYRDVVQTKKIQISDSGEPMQKEKFENIVVTEKHIETFVPFKSILNVTKSSLPKDSEIYYMILSK